MAKATGPTDYPVINELLEHPRRFAFYQAVRLLERYTKGIRMGYQGPPRSEPLRLRAWDALQFPVWDVEEIFQEENPWGNPASRFKLTATFMGIYGPASPIPTNYTECLIQPSDLGTEEDRARLRAFLDIFDHRILSLHYRAMSKYRYHFLYELGGVDSYSGYMHCLIGRGTEGLRKERPVPAFMMVRYAGLLTQQPKSAVGLRGLLADFFEGIKVEVQQCAGRWLNVEDTNRLGQDYCKLGSDMIIGSRVYDRMGKFRVSLGPVGLKTFMKFLPNGEEMKKLKELVKLYLLDELDFDVEIWLRGDEVPPTIMATGPMPPMLGWTSFVVQGAGPDRSIVFTPN